jgi:hypothetical protein
MPRLVSGYYLVHRSMNEGDIGKSPYAFRIMCELISRANIKESTISWRGRPRKCPRGSLLISIHSFSEDLGMDRHTVTKWLVYLKNRGTIGLETLPHQGTFISILNYDAYQPSGKNKVNKSPAVGEDFTNHLVNESTIPPTIPPTYNNKYNEGYEGSDHVRNFENRFSPDIKPILEDLKTAFNGHVPYKLKHNIGAIVSAYGSHARFRAKFEHLVNKPQALKIKQESEVAWEDYVVVSMLREVGVMRDPA